MQIRKFIETKPLINDNFFVVCAISSDYHKKNTKYVPSHCTDEQHSSATEKNLRNSTKKFRVEKGYGANFVFGFLVCKSTAA